MSLARQQKDIFIHGDKVLGSPVHGGIIPPHGGTGQPAGASQTGPIHGDSNLDPANLGPELIVNGNFAAGGTWTLGTGCTISGGVLNCVAGAQLCWQPITYSPGSTYRVQLDYTMSAGSKLRVNQSNVNGANIRATSAVLGASGTVVFTDFVVDGTAWISIEADSAAFSGTLDNISLKKVG